MGDFVSHLCSAPGDHICCPGDQDGRLCLCDCHRGDPEEAEPVSLGPGDGRASLPWDLPDSDPAGDIRQALDDVDTWRWPDW